MIVKMSAMPQIIINGERCEVEDVTLLSDLLTRLKLNAQHLAVAVNDKVVPRSSRSATKIKEGDRIEVIHAVGGG